MLYSPWGPFPDRFVQHLGAFRASQVASQVASRVASPFGGVARPDWGGGLSPIWRAARASDLTFEQNSQNSVIRLASEEHC